MNTYKTIIDNNRIFENIFDRSEIDLPENYEFLIVEHQPYGNIAKFATCGDQADMFFEYIESFASDYPCTLCILDSDWHSELLLQEVCVMYDVDLNSSDGKCKSADGQYYNVLVHNDDPSGFEYPSQIARYSNFKMANDHATRIIADGGKAYVAPYRMYA